VVIKNPNINDARDVVVQVMIFDNRSGWVNQQVLWENIRATEFVRTDENRTAIFKFPFIARGETKVMNFQQIVKVDRTEFDLNQSTDVVIPPELLPLTKPVEYLWENHPELVAKALELSENARTPREKLQRIFEFVKGYLIYEEQQEEHSALWAYQNRIGDCTEFTNLIIALCRLSGIPAKFVSAIGYSKEKGGSLYTMGHAFAIVYLPDLGWIPVDATWSSPKGELGESSEDKLVMLVSDGSNLLKDSRITIPRDYITYSYMGTNPDLKLESRAVIYKEVGLDVRMNSSSVLGEGNTWDWYVTITNEGLTTLSNLRVKLMADNQFIEVPEEVVVDNLPAGWNRTLAFKLKVKKSVENLPIKAMVEYESPYGQFLSTTEGKTTVTLQELPATEFLQSPQGILILIAVAAIVVAIVAFAIRGF